MSMIAKDTGNISFEKLEAGVYTAVSSAMIDLGLQTSKKFGNTQRKFMMIWTILGEEVEVNGQKQARIMSKEYSFSLNEKSTLRKDLQAWRGKVFTEQELEGFNILNVLNKACQLQIILEEKEGRQYNNIASIMSLPKGTTVDGLKDTYYLDLENEETWMNWEKVPNWIQEKIKKSDNYTNSGMEKFVKEYEEAVETIEQTGNCPVSTDDDLPF